MNLDAQHKLFDEIIKPKVFIIRDLQKGGVREEVNEYTGEPFFIKEKEEYIKYGEFTIKGFPVANTYFPYILQLCRSFIAEVKANSYFQSVNYSKYLSDLRVTLEKLLHYSFEDFHGLTRYKYFTEIVHVNFMHVDHHFQITDVDRESVIHVRVHEFSEKLLEILQDVQEKLNTIYSRKNITESNDTRINCRASREDIQNYFHQLNKQNINGEQILTQEQIDRFLQANFQGFGEPIEQIILNPVGLTEADIRYFIHDFITHFDPKGNRQCYARICKDSFLQFETSEISSIASNFSKKPKKYFLG